MFAQSGSWWVGEVNAELLEAVLGYSRARGPARLLLAALAALSDARGVVEELMTDELCRAAGLANSTYRRARTTLLASGEVGVDRDAGGRGRTCRWTVRYPAELGKAPTSEPKRRTTPPPGVRPLIAAARADASAELEKGPALSGVLSEGPTLSGVSGRKAPVLSGVPRSNPAKTPPPNARAGREPMNRRISNPPTPLEGGAPSAG